jgi:DNA-binding transcriptional ArsR family regulator
MRGVWFVRLLLLLFVASSVHGAMSLATQADELSPEEEAFKDGAEQGALAGENEENAQDSTEEDATPAKMKDPEDAEGDLAENPNTRLPFLYLSGGLLGLVALFFSSVFFEFMKVMMLMAIVVPMVAQRKQHNEDELTKGRILGYIEANTGIHFSALRDGLNLANGVTAYHTNNLEKEGKIFSWKAGKHRRYASIHVPKSERNRFQNPLSGTRLAILEVLAQEGNLGVEPKEIRERLEISRQLLSHHLNELHTNRLIEQSEGKRKKSWQISSFGKEQLVLSRMLLESP